MKKGARHIDFGDRVVDPLVGSLFAGTAGGLSMAAVFPVVVATQPPVTALGLFFIPAIVAVSMDATGSPRVALTVFIVFYVTCLFATWWWYRREGAEVRCD